MFVHSVKPPRLYKAAATALREIKENGQSLRNTVFKAKHPNIRAIHSLVLETLNRYEEIDELFDRTKLLEKEKISPWLARILLTELKWGKKRLGGESRPEQAIISYFSDIVVDDDQKRRQSERVKPRYVRVNTIKISVNEAIQLFEDLGWNYVCLENATDYEEFLSRSALLHLNEFMSDMHVEDLLVFPSNHNLFKSKPYNDGLIVLQDKASCFPICLLNPTPGSVVLDMCAAPGMKTTQIASMLKNQGKVYAVERDPKRFELLKQQVDKYGATCVETINADVLSIGRDTCIDAEYILVDPSCSGTGMIKQITTEVTEARLASLANFQAIVLKHAMRHFPNAKRIVYSTCSEKELENECVVMDALSQTDEFRLVPARELLKNPWKNSTTKNWKEITDHCIYASREHDLTDGFFTAVFERIEKSRFGKNKRIKQEPQDEDSKGKINLKMSHMEIKHEVSKKKRTNSEMELKVEDESEIEESVTSRKKSKKKRKDSETEESKKRDSPEVEIKIEISSEEEGESITTSKKKSKKRRKHSETELIENNSEGESSTIEKKSKKSKKKKGLPEVEIQIEEEEEIEIKSKSKKSKKKISDDDLIVEKKSSKSEKKSKKKRKISE